MFDKKGVFKGLETQFKIIFYLECFDSLLMYQKKKQWMNIQGVPGNIVLNVFFDILY